MVRIICLVFAVKSTLGMLFCLKLCREHRSQEVMLKILSSFKYSSINGSNAKENFKIFVFTLTGTRK